MNMKPYNMPSTLGNAGSCRIYASDGSGRDSYVRYNMGGNTSGYKPAPATGLGQFSTVKEGYSPQKVERGGLGGSPPKRFNYAVNGTGRDTYIHCNNGGFKTNYAWKKDYDVYI